MSVNLLLLLLLLLLFLARACRQEPVLLSTAAGAHEAGSLIAFHLSDELVDKEIRKNVFTWENLMAGLVTANKSYPCGARTTWWWFEANQANQLADGAGSCRKLSLAVCSSSLLTRLRKVCESASQKGCAPDPGEEKWGNRGRTSCRYRQLLFCLDQCASAKHLICLSHLLPVKNSHLVCA